MLKCIYPVVGLDDVAGVVKYRWNRLLLEFDRPVTVPPVDSLEVSAEKIPPYNNLEELADALCYHVTDPEMIKGILAPLSRGGASEPVPAPVRQEVRIQEIWSAASVKMEPGPGCFLVLVLDPEKDMGLLQICTRLLDPTQDFSIQLRVRKPIQAADGSICLNTDLPVYTAHGATINPYYDQFVHGCFSAPGDDVFYEVKYPSHMDPKKTYPLIVATAGAGFNYTGHNRGVQAICTMNRLLLENAPDAIILSPQLHFGFQWYPDGGPAVAMLKDFIQKTPQVDSERIYVTGQSAGSIATWAYLQFCPELFACAMPGSGGPRYRGMNMDSLKPGQLEECLQAIADAETPVYIHHGAADPIAFFHESAEAIVLMQQIYRDMGKNIEELHRLVPMEIYTKKHYGKYSGHSICDVMYNREHLQKLMSYRRPAPTPGTGCPQ